MTLSHTHSSDMNSALLFLYILVHTFASRCGWNEPLKAWKSIPGEPCPVMECRRIVPGFIPCAECPTVTEFWTFKLNFDFCSLEAFSRGLRRNGCTGRE